MAFDSFIKIDGIKGETEDSVHKGEIEVFSFTWGCKQTASASAGTGGGSGKVNIQDLSFVKKIDTASPVLFQKCCQGEHIKNAAFVVRKAGGTQLEFVKVKLIDVLITSVALGGSSGEDEIPMETVTLSFTECHFDYQAQGADGKASGGPVHGGWNVKQNKTV